jgi:hypothetical protein
MLQDIENYGKENAGLIELITVDKNMKDHEAISGLCRKTAAEQRCSTP